MELLSQTKDFPGFIHAMCTKMEGLFKLLDRLDLVLPAFAFDGPDGTFKVRVPRQGVEMAYFGTMRFWERWL